MLAVVSIITSCETTAETYSEFTKEGEKVYIGTPDTILVAPGINKLQFSVVINADPKIKKGLIATKDKSISHEFEVLRKNTGQDTTTFILDLDEGEYNFDLVLKDDAGNQSIPREVTSIVYGEKYRNTLISRNISDIIITRERAIIKWGNAPEGSYSTSLSYEDGEGTMQNIDIPNDITETVLDSYKLSGEIKISSSFKPTKNAIESFNSMSETTFPDRFILDHSKITALRLPFDASDGCYGSSYERLTDGTTGAYWHSCDTPEDLYPWVMSFDLGVNAKVKGFKLDQRSDCCGGRSPGSYQIWGTNNLSDAATKNIDEVDMEDWESESISKGWVKLVDVSNNTNPTFEVDIPENSNNFRYIRIVGISSINGELEANFDEFTFYANEVE